MEFLITYGFNRHKMNVSIVDGHELNQIDTQQSVNNETYFIEVIEPNSSVFIRLYEQTIIKEQRLIKKQAQFIIDNLVKGTSLSDLTNEYGFVIKDESQSYSRIYLSPT
ncbi:hypothetical protein FC21_GL000069 [Limosilactobacillus equigenerosi DSM 18793 = JCM 14505]|uniref:Uncharacterized protein n=1 Tax=Limosilactobacillus equigenerosi DSM 18793 = JCM 14505 TaxID=1423742 RepID=A0A0R1UNI9_9LACO|nr:hypothetical protein FC21_GL000069 [Limosilactobacillus equigenerosi DSM 18793 = JCM 14505]